MKSFLKSENYLLTVIVLAMLNNLEHSAVVYHDISRNIFPYAWANWSLSIAVVVIIDLSVFAFVIQGKHLVAGIYAVMIFLVNLLYYGGLDLFTINTNEKIASMVFSGMFTYSIYEFSRMYSLRIDEMEIEENKQHFRESIKNIGSDGTKSHPKYNSNGETEVKCACGREFSTIQGWNGHKCSMKEIVIKGATQDVS